MVDLTPDLLSWYTINKRELPWRQTNNPYAIWLSEIILQQTRIDQGLSYYQNFINRFPTVNDLASAEEDEILKLWQGLGYYSRARNMHTSAKSIVENYDCRFPETYQEILKLKGVGEYTAAAIASISFNLAHAVVDGNVYRVLSRIFGIPTPIDSSSGKKEFYELANKLIDKTNPGEYNQAIMEFGALHCTPKNPDCENCIFKNRCVAVKSKLVGLLPVKSGKTKIRHRYFNYLLFDLGEEVFLQKRTRNDIWKNLYEFPLIETTDKEEITSIAGQLKQFINSEEIQIDKVTAWEKQILSHQHIHYRFVYICYRHEKNKLPHLIKVNKKDIFNFAVPKPVEREMEKLNW